MIVAVFQPFFADRVADSRHQFISNIRLLDIVMGTLAQGSADMVNRAFATDHNCQGIDCCGPHELQHLVTINLGHGQI